MNQDIESIIDRIEDGDGISRLLSSGSHHEWSTVGGSSKVFPGEDSMIVSAEKKK